LLHTENGNGNLLFVCCKGNGKRSKGDNGLPYSGIDEIPVSHLQQMEKMPESIFDQTKPCH
jgi:hypothetical protein